MVNHKGILPFDVLYEDEVRKEFLGLVFDKCTSKSKEQSYEKVVKHIDRYLQTHFDIITAFSDTDTDSDPEKSDFNNSLLDLIFEQHPLFNESSYDTLMNIVDSFIENNSPILNKELLDLYRKLIKHNKTNSLKQQADVLLKEDNSVPIPDLITFLNKEILDLSLNIERDEDIIDFYRSLLEFFKTQYLIKPINKNLKKNTDPESFTDLLVKEYKPFSDEILLMLKSDTKRTVVDEFNHWIAELQVAYVFYETLKAEGVLKCTLENFKKMLALQFKNFNIKGVKKPLETARAYDFKPEFISMLNKIKDKI